MRGRAGLERPPLAQRVSTRFYSTGKSHVSAFRKRLSLSSGCLEAWSPGATHEERRAPLLNELRLASLHGLLGRAIFRLPCCHRHPFHALCSSSPSEAPSTTLRKRRQRNALHVWSGEIEMAPRVPCRPRFSVANLLAWRRGRAHRAGSLRAGTLAHLCASGACQMNLVAGRPRCTVWAPAMRGLPWGRAARRGAAGILPPRVSRGVGPGRSKSRLGHGWGAKWGQHSLGCPSFWGAASCGGIRGPGPCAPREPAAGCCCSRGRRACRTGPSGAGAGAAIWTRTTTATGQRP